MYSKLNSKARTLDNIDFLVSIGDFKLQLSLPKNTTVAGLITIVKGYEALHQEYGPQGQPFIGLGAINFNPFLDYWLAQGSLDFMRFKKKQQIKALYGSERRSDKIGIAQFQFLVCLGKGGNGEVYLVRNRISGSIMALKRVRKEKIQTYNCLMTQFRQRKSMIQLGNNVHTVTLHAAFQSAFHFNFLMQYCPGGELFFHLSDKNNLTMPDIKHYFCQILLAMQYIHKRKILYRDLKPENIFVDANGHLKIGDFGLSKCNFEQDDSAYSICGSEQYMAPEVVQNKDYNFSADFYSIGAILYELITGYPPYYKQDITIKQKLKLMKNMDLELDTKTNDPLLKELLINLLHPDPDKRISNFQEIKNSPWLSKVDWKSVEARNDILKFAPDPSRLCIGKQFLDLQHEVQEMNYQEEDGFHSQISETFQYIRPESKKLLALDNEILPSKILKPKPNAKVDKKHSKKTNLSVALFDKQNPSECISNSQVHLVKDQCRQNKQNIKGETVFKKGITKQASHHVLLLNNKVVSTQSINLNSQKSQRSMIINTSECSIKTSKANSRTKDIQPRGQIRSKGGSKQKSMKSTSLSKGMKRKQDKKTVLPSCSFKIKLS